MNKHTEKKIIHLVRLQRFSIIISLGKKSEEVKTTTRPQSATFHPQCISTYNLVSNQLSKRRNNYSSEENNNRYKPLKSHPINYVPSPKLNTSHFNKKFDDVVVSVKLTS